MTSKEIRAMEITSRLSIEQVHYHFLTFLQEIAAQIAEFNEGSLLTQHIDLVETGATEPAEGMILTGQEAVDAAKLEMQIHQAKQSLQNAPIFTPVALSGFQYEQVIQKSPFVFPPSVAPSVAPASDGLIGTLDDA